MATGGPSRGAGQMPKPKILGKLQINFNRRKSRERSNKVFTSFMTCMESKSEVSCLDFGLFSSDTGIFLFLKWAMKRKDKVINWDIHAHLVLFDY